MTNDSNNVIEEDGKLWPEHEEEAQRRGADNRKSSSPAAALVKTKSSLTFQLHPKQPVAFRSEATEILYRGAAGGGGKRPHAP